MGETTICKWITQPRIILTIPLYPIKVSPALASRTWGICSMVQYPVVLCYAVLRGMVPCAIVRLCHSAYLTYIKRSLPLNQQVH